ncbi:MAG: hypothetical protein ACK4N4_04970 [Burkholderiales bacterium]
MSKSITGLFILTAALFTACAPLPPTPQDLQAKKFEAVPNQSVIYIVRTPMDSRQVGSLMLDDGGSLTTYRDTYYRWVVAPGRHRIAGFGQQNAVITLDTEAGKIYFVEHTVLGTTRTGAAFTFLRRMDEQAGREAVLRSELLSPF